MGALVRLLLRGIIIVADTIFVMLSELWWGEQLKNGTTPVALGFSV